MNAKRWMPLVLMMVLAVVFPVRADNSPAKRDDSQQDIRELKQLVLELTARLERIEGRLSQLEKRLERPAQATKDMVPLGTHFMVDSNGIIWDEGRPVGVWGVNGRGMPMPPLPTR